jgi:hypothetical protein
VPFQGFEEFPVRHLMSACFLEHLEQHCGLDSVSFVIGFDKVLIDELLNDIGL